MQKGLAKNLVNAPRPAPDRGEGGGRFYAAFLRKLPAVLAPHGAHAGAVSAAGTGGAADTAGGDRRCAGRAVARGGTKVGRLRSRRGQAYGRTGGLPGYGRGVNAGRTRRRCGAGLQKMYRRGRKSATARVVGLFAKRPREKPSTPCGGEMGERRKRNRIFSKINKKCINLKNVVDKRE